MTNQEIDARLGALADAIPNHADRLIRGNDGQRSVQIELELLNMSMMAVFAMLGEIAKRLPEPKDATDSKFKSPRFDSYEDAFGWAIKCGLDLTKHHSCYSGRENSWYWERIG